MRKTKGELCRPPAAATPSEHSGSSPVEPADPEVHVQPQAFIETWLKEKLPANDAEFSVVQLAEQLRADAAAAGVTLNDPDFSIEEAVLAAVNARPVPPL
jgi:hypothetical protein